MNKKKTLALTTISLAILLSGCNKSKTEFDTASIQQSIDDQINIANTHLNQGEPKTALSILENLEHSHPDQASVLEALGFAHSAQGDHELSAFYFDQVFRLDPAHVDACLFAAEGYKALGQWDMAIKNYEIYVQTYSKDAAVWKIMGDIYNTMGRPHTALKAYLTYTKLKETPVTAEEHLKLAKLSTQLGNTQQAESFYTAALNEEAHQEEALLGLLQINLTTQDWSTIQNIVLVLDEVNPEALNNSSFSGIRAELQAWQDEMNARANAEAEVELTLTKQLESHSEGTEQQETAVQQWIKKTQKDRLARKWKRGKQQPKSVTESETTQEEAAPTAVANQPKTQVAEANTPQNWANDPSLNQVKTVDNTLKLVFSSILSHSQGTQLAQDAIASSSENPFIPEAVRNLDQPQPGITAKDIKALPARVVQEEVKKPTPAEFFASGKKLKSIGQYEDAIQDYWQGLAMDDSMPSFWNELSETYMMYNQFEEAEMTALEALRRDPNNIQYTLNFLRAAHKTKPSSTFLNELAKAERRFPKSPEITLALARVYDNDSIEQNPRKAAVYYNKFVHEFPNHPKKPEALLALQRLQ